jgi:hypothetical protein
VLAALTTFLLSALAAATPAPAAGPTSPATGATAPPSPLAPATPTPECPSAAELAPALNALIPGLVTAAPASTPLPLAGGYRLGVATTHEGDVRVDLADAQGEVALHRMLPAPPRGHAPDCPALAETIALIVDRYLHDIGFEVPPLPPPEPAPAPPPSVTEPPATVVVPGPAAAAPARALWRLGLMGNARRGDAGGFDSDGDLALGVESTGTGARWGGRVSAGYARPADARWSDKAATLRRVPVRLGLYLAIPVGPGRLEPGVGAGADLLVVSASGPGTADDTRVAPSGDLALGYALPLPGPVYARVLSRAALAVPYTFKALDGSPVWATPRVYGEIGVELGFAFP